MPDFSAELADETIVSQNFEKTTGPGSKLPFKDSKHTHFLFSISHSGVPPIANDPTNPAIRIYGTFPSADAAVKHGKKIMDADPTCHLGVGECHKWTLACCNLKNLADSEYIQAKTSRLLKRNNIENSVREARFKQHQEELRKATVIKDEVPLNQKKIGEDEPETPAIVEVVNDLPTLTSECMPVNQSVFCVSVVNDEPSEDVPEFLFYVYRTCRDETEADGYVRGVASREVSDYNIYVVDCCEWVFPMTDMKFAPKTYRDKRLNDIMNRDMTPEELMKEIDATSASNASGAVLDDKS